MSEIGKATPRPWKVVNGSVMHTDRPYQIVSAATGDPVTRWGTTFITPALDTGKANAALIVEAVNSFEALAAERDALRALTQWQPIATVPRDGTTVLLYAAAWEMTHDSVQTGHFEGDGEGSGEWCIGDFYTADNEPDFDPDAEVESFDFDGFEDDDMNVGPTHWLPLPKPPVTP